MQYLIAIIIFITAAILSFISPLDAIKCFECFDTGPTNKECTKEKSCTGAACLIFEDANNVTSSAFCLLTTEHVALNKVSPGCWLEPDGKSKHCVCFTEFCNKLRDKTLLEESNDGPLSVPLKDLGMLKHNPFLDYEYVDPEDKGEDRLHARPAPTNLLFPSALEEDAKVAGHSTSDEQDLVPIDFEEYQNFENTGKLDDPKVAEADAASSSSSSFLFLQILPYFALIFFTTFLIIKF
uniref:Uncharacterized protein n=1 Tax=Panagrolaimus superbus TaxID=310955 RepID=A0A914YDE6_9BILA